MTVYVQVIALTLIFGLGGSSLAAEWRDRAEAEGKVVIYTTANTSDAKGVVDGFKQIYPKIEVQFHRSTDSQMMERILSESRAGKPLWDVVSTTGYYGYQLKKRGILAAYDSPERKYYRDGFKDGADAAAELDSYHPENSGDYKKATNGYEDSYGDKDLYKESYRSAYLTGYRSGFNSIGVTDNIG